LKSHFGQNLHTPRLVQMDRIVIAGICPQVKTFSQFSGQNAHNSPRKILFSDRTALCRQ
jgi:hypothetical protein